MKRTTLLTALALALASITASAQQNAVPPPSAPALRSATELEKLVAPIALYSDPLIATILPASVYPLEIVQAARFVANTNNLANLDAQPWDENVKAVACVPAAIKAMNDDLQWTIALGEAFLARDKDLLDAVQNLRGRAQQAGTLQTTPQQSVVVVTNRVIVTTAERQTAVVTNTVVQIQPVNPDVVYVPTYNPYTAYYPPPGYVYNPYAPLVTFGVGVAVGAIIANNCDWHSGGVYVGHHGAVVWSNGGYHHGDVNVNQNVNIDRSANINQGNRGAQATPYNKSGPAGAQQKWQPDQKRLSSAGTLGSKGAASTLEARGWSSSAGARATPSSGSVGARPSSGNVAARPSTGNVAARPSTGGLDARPSASPSPSARPSRSSSSWGSAFGGVSSGSSTRDFSSRGSSSRSGGGFSGGRSGGGGGRGGRR